MHGVEVVDPPPAIVRATLVGGAIAFSHVARRSDAPNHAAPTVTAAKPTRRSAITITLNDEKYDMPNLPRLRRSTHLQPSKGPMLSAKLQQNWKIVSERCLRRQHTHEHYILQANFCKHVCLSKPTNSSSYHLRLIFDAGWAKILKRSIDLLLLTCFLCCICETLVPQSQERCIYATF